MIASAASCLLAVVLISAAVIALRVLLDALVLFHTAGLARLHHHDTRELTP